MFICDDIDEFIDLISSRKILIYGAGYVASIFLKALNKHGFDKKIYGFVVSKLNNNQNNIDGFPVMSLDQAVFNDETIVCVAVHESIKENVEQTLCDYGIINYIWVYPFLYEMYFGKPVEEKKWINIREIVPDIKDHYALAIRWAAIDDYYGNFSEGFYLYKKALSIHSDESTAEARVQNFRNLIQNWDIIGYQDKYQIAINTRYEIIDGEHRMALALYHNQHQILCKIFDGKNMHGENILMTRKALLEGNFMQEEIKKLDEINFYIGKFIL